jgi:hypothetical protein
VKSAPRALALATLVGAALVGCVDGGLDEGEVLGRERKVAFSTETQLAFTTRLALGSRFTVKKRALDPEEKAIVDAARLESSAPEVVAIDGGDVTVTGPGSADLVVVGDDGVIDRITLQAAVPGATTLASGPVLSVVNTVDARLPSTFAVRTDADTLFFVSSLDKCGGELLDLHASHLEASGDVPAAIDEKSAASFVVKTQVPGNLTLTLKSPGIEDLAYSVKSVEPSAVDEVHAAPTSLEGTTVTLFGRAFIDDVELVADLAFSWSANERVTLGATQGMAVSADVSFPVDGAPPDDRPAIVTAEVFGESGSVNLIGAVSVNDLGPPARVPPPPPQPTGGGCGGGAAPCDPAAALVGLFGLGGLRRLRGIGRLRAPPARGHARGAAPRHHG